MGLLSDWLKEPAAYSTRNRHFGHSPHSRVCDAVLALLNNVETLH